jgi:quinol-cytochrome oxidoreductase complex cytochrome b subunit
MFLHLLREWAYGRYHGFRLYSWVTGVPLIWLVFISGIGGYWIVWDRLAQFSAVATTELLDWLPIFRRTTARNFLAPDSINDRFFTVLVFIHIGVPLMLILGLWAHVNRISRVDYLPSRRVMLATLGAFLLLAAIKPAVSDAPADLSLVPLDLRIDWFILFLHPLTDLTSPAAVWTLIFGATDPALRPALPAASAGASRSPWSMRRTATAAAAATPIAPMKRSSWRRIRTSARTRSPSSMPTSAPPAASAPVPAPRRRPSAASSAWSPASTCRNCRWTRCAGSSKRASPGFPAAPGWWSSVATGAPTSAPSRHPIRQR